MHLNKLYSSMLLGMSVMMMGTMTVAQEKVMIPSRDIVSAKVPEVLGHWFPVALSANKTSAPTLILLHGCGGAYNKSGGFSARMKNYVEMFHQQGWHVLILDSFTSRNVKEICTQKYLSRSIHPKQRREDVYSALNWLATQSIVDESKVALVGWSNGGSTVLASTDTSNTAVAKDSVKLKASVAFYPGCKNFPNYQTQSPVLVLIGAADDWTPAMPCTDLQKRQTDQIQLEVYPDAYHGFDSDAPIKLRQDVPNGTNPGKGVHVGGNSAAFEASKKRMLEFLHQTLD